MAAKVNRYTWIKSEAYGKKVAKKLGYVQIIDVMVFDKRPKTMGKNKIAIAKGFYKIIVNDDKDFEKCFYYENDLNINPKGDKLKSHTVECSKAFRALKQRI
jgi:endonuclease G